MEDLLKQIYEQKRMLEEEKEKAENYTNEVKQLKEELSKQKLDLTSLETQRIESAKREALLILEEAKQEANEIIAKLEEKPNLKEANQLRASLNTSIQKWKKKESVPVQAEKTPEVWIGSLVLVKSLNQEATVLSLPNHSKEVTLQMGNAKMKTKLSDLALLEASPKEKYPKSSYVHTNLHTNTVSSEINLIGYCVEEALSALDQYIDHCLVAKFSPIRIVHGKGTGKLRSSIHTYLKSHPSIESFRLGTFGEGEMGVTIAELKIK